MQLEIAYVKASQFLNQQLKKLEESRLNENYKAMIETVKEALEVGYVEVMNRSNSVFLPPLSSLKANYRCLKF